MKVAIVWLDTVDAWYIAVEYNTILNTVQKYKKMRWDVERKLNVYSVNVGKLTSVNHILTAPDLFIL